QWNKESGYYRQARVENAFFRYKSIIGDRLRARHPRAQAPEGAIACKILNRMNELGRPTQFATGP
ncbi:MAG: IS5/IS1182 family transposase, partial [bacterium]